MKKMLFTKFLYILGKNQIIKKFKIKKIKVNMKKSKAQKIKNLKIEKFLREILAFVYMYLLYPLMP